MCEFEEAAEAIMEDLNRIHWKIRKHVVNWLPSKTKFVVILWIFNGLMSHACCQSLGEYKI